MHRRMDGSSRGWMNRLYRFCGRTWPELAQSLRQLVPKIESRYRARFRYADRGSSPWPKIRPPNFIGSIEGREVIFGFAWGFFA